jgi:hypothetical protein
MTAPNPVVALYATSDFSSSITLRHREPQGVSPEILGYKYFHSTIGLSDVLAKANADIAAHLAAKSMQPPPADPGTTPAVPPVNYGGVPLNTNVLVDEASPMRDVGTSAYGYPPVAPTRFSRDNLAEDIYFVHVVGAPVPLNPVTHYYAVVVWNDDGASVATTSEVVHRVPSAPGVIDILARETEIDIAFDQPVRSPTGRDGEGFRVTINGVAAYPDDAVFVNPSMLRLTMAGVISDRDTVRVSYDATKGDLTDSTGGHPLATFSDVIATNTSNHATLQAAVVASNKIDPETLTLVFSIPVVATDYLIGLGFTVNGVIVVPTGVTSGQDPRDILVTFANSFQYSDVVLVTYDASVGDWTSNGYPLKTIRDLEAINASKIGTPDSDYPLSSVVREPLEPKKGSVWAKVGIDLNFIDRLLVDRYGPANVDFGGTFGATPENIQGCFLYQDIRSLVTGMLVEKEFLVPGHPDQAAVAAAEWLEVVTQRVGLALGILRTQDRHVVLGQRTARQV